MHQDRTKPAAVSDEQRNGDNPPDDSRHGQEATHLAACECVPCVDADLLQHGASLLPRGAELR